MNFFISRRLGGPSRHEGATADTNAGVYVVTKALRSDKIVSLYIVVNRDYNRHFRLL